MSLRLRQRCSNHEEDYDGQPGLTVHCHGRGYLEDGELTFPANVRADWLTSASGVAGWLSLLSATDPLPPVAVTVPRERVPSGPIGSATTLLDSSLVMKYIALPVDTALPKPVDKMRRGKLSAWLAKATCTRRIRGAWENNIVQFFQTMIANRWGSATIGVQSGCRETEGGYKDEGGFTDSS